MEQGMPAPPQFQRDISLKEVKEFLDQLGMKIEMLKFVAISYRTSLFAMSGVLLKFGALEFGIGPSDGAKVLIEPSTTKLNLCDLNGAAIYACLLDFRNSKLKDKGLSFLADDVLIRIGPQRDPLVIHPKRTPIQSKLEGLR